MSLERNRMFRAEAIVAQAEGVYMVAMDLPGNPGLWLSFEAEPRDFYEFAVLHPPAIIAEIVGLDTRPFRPLYKAVGTFHKAAVALPLDRVKGGRQPVRLRALRVGQNSGYVGTVQTFDGGEFESKFVVKESDEGQWVASVPANLQRFAGPCDENVAQVLRAVVEFHKAVQSQI